MHVRWFFWRVVPGRRERRARATSYPLRAKSCPHLFVARGGGPGACGVAGGWRLRACSPARFRWRGPGAPPALRAAPPLAVGRAAITQTFAELVALRSSTAPSRRWCRHRHAGRRPRRRLFRARPGQSTDLRFDRRHPGQRPAPPRAGGPPEGLGGPQARANKPMQMGTHAAAASPRPRRTRAQAAAARHEKMRATLSTQWGEGLPSQALRKRIVAGRALPTLRAASCALPGVFGIAWGVPQTFGFFDRPMKESLPWQSSTTRRSTA